ncbi:hypothetical protein Ancab_038758 [Ancistrocladus abbreviatus]
MEIQNHGFLMTLTPLHLPNSSSLTDSAGGGRNTNLDRVLYNDLVEIVPLVQSLIDRKSTNSFTRRGSMIYTKTPSRDSLSKKYIDPKGRNAAKSMPGKKRGDNSDKDQDRNSNIVTDGSTDGFSVFSSTNMASEKDRGELIALKEQVEDLQQKLLEKGELLRAAEDSKSQISSMQAKFDELKQYAAEKDCIIKSTQLQLSDAKIKLADKQAALEKVQWEALTSNQKVEKLQEDIDSMETQISTFMLLFEGLSKDDSALTVEDYDIFPYHMDHVPYIDDMDEVKMQKMEEARKAYIVAVAVAKEKQDEESLAAAANARLHLQSFVFGKNNNITEENSEIGISAAEALTQ